MLVVVIWIEFTFVETASDTLFECVSNLFRSEKQKVISKQMDHTNGTRTNFRYNGVDPIINSIGNNFRCCFNFVSECETKRLSAHRTLARNESHLSCCIVQQVVVPRGSAGANNQVLKTETWLAIEIRFHN